LAVSIRVGLRNLLNPILAGLAGWFTYKLGKKFFDELSGLIALILIGSSPFLYLQSGTLLSHLWSLLLTSAFVLFWIDLIDDQEVSGKRIKTIICGLCLGMLGLTRPLTMVAVTLPFFIHGIILLIRGRKEQRKTILLVGLISLITLSLHFVWQWAATGDFRTNLYTLWWDYDRIGFGVGFGVTPEGHSLSKARVNTLHSLKTGMSDLFGWGKLSWIFLPFGLWAVNKSRKALLLWGLIFSLVILYSFYWIGSWLLGPRYYFECLSALSILSAAGISYLAGWWDSSRLKTEITLIQRSRPLVIFGLLCLLIFGNFYYYLPARLDSLKGLYGITRENLSIFNLPELDPYKPALVIVDSEFWMGYANLLELQSPSLDSPLIFAWSTGRRKDQALAEVYQNQRNVLYYYPDLDPEHIYTHPQK
jgi:4-amino-4-deoxy-L-arabinose transferase-like glycosyltransferase